MCVDVCAWNPAQNHYENFPKLKGKNWSTEDFQKFPTNGFMLSLSEQKRPLASFNFFSMETNYNFCVKKMSENEQWIYGTTTNDQQTKIMLVYEEYIVHKK